jgi:tRNA A37 threonylcarbamoyladenosine dehydratase
MTNRISDRLTDGVDAGEQSRFGGIARLYGLDAWERIRAARVMVVGIGGVGSWAVEALARTGIGHLILVDFDEVCVTNVNRQIHALDGTVGQSKVNVMADRVGAISPECTVVREERFFTSASAQEILSLECDVVIDAIDTVRDKALLLAECHRRGLNVVTCGGAGGKRDPSKIRVADLGHTTHDALLKQVRKVLRREHGWPGGDTESDGDGHSFGIHAVFAAEHSVFPQSDGTVCAEVEPGSQLRLNCDAGLGTATHVTGTFGFVAASEAIRAILSRGV